MNERKFDVQVHRRSLPDKAEVAVIAVCGEMDRRSETRLKAAFDEALQRSPIAVVLDLGGVSYINSVGVAQLIGLLARSRASHCRLLACGLSAQGQEILRLTRLTDYLQNFADEHRAIEALTFGV